MPVMGPPIVSPDCRDGNCGKCYGQAFDEKLDSPIECQHDCHPADPLFPAPPAPEYGEGYWERGEGSNYHGYGDDPGWDKIAAVLKEYTAFIPHPEVLELGCASGYFVAAARRAGIAAVGMDVSEYALSKAPEEVQPFLQLRSATDLAAMPTGHFGAVVSWEMLEHIPDEEIVVALAGMTRILAPGGLFIHKIALDTDGVEGYEHIPFHDARGDSSHVTLWKPETWRTFFEKMGLEPMMGIEAELNAQFEDRDWHNRFFAYRKPMPS